MRGAPAANDDIALGCKFENFLDLEQRQTGLVGAPALDHTGLALEEALQCALAQMHLLGHVIDDLVAYDIQAQFLGELLSDEFSLRTRFLIHGDHRHDKFSSLFHRT